MKPFPLLLLLLASLDNACIHPMPNPGQVVISCGWDAVSDPRIKQEILDALAQANFEAAILSLINPGLGITEAFVICFLKSYLATPGAGADSVRAQHARAYLQRRGVQ
jgi:hypothetical protein